MTTMSSGPRLGQMVHYRAYGSADGTYPSACRAALVTAVYSDEEALFVPDEPKVGLAVLNPTGMFFNTANFDASKTNGGTWHYECPNWRED